MTSMKLMKAQGKSVSRLRNEMEGYKELLMFVASNPDREFVESMVKDMRINVIRCQKKISEETARYTNGMISKDTIKEIQDEFDYSRSSRRLRYLNFLLQD